jgi:hypothetical protein
MRTFGNPHVVRVDTLNVFAWVLDLLAMASMWAAVVACRLISVVVPFAFIAGANTTFPVTNASGLRWQPNWLEPSACCGGMFHLSPNASQTCFFLSAVPVPRSVSLVSVVLVLSVSNVLLERPADHRARKLGPLLLAEQPSLLLAVSSCGNRFISLLTTQASVLSRFSGWRRWHLHVIWLHRLHIQNIGIVSFNVGYGGRTLRSLRNGNRVSPPRATGQLSKQQRLQRQHRQRRPEGRAGPGNPDP